MSFLHVMKFVLSKFLLKMSLFILSLSPYPHKHYFVLVDPERIHHSAILKSCVQDVESIHSISLYAHLRPHLDSRQRRASGQGDLDVPRTSLTFATK